MKPALTCRYLATVLTNGGRSPAVLFSSDHIVCLATPPASAAPSNFSSPLSLRRGGRSQIICRRVSYLKVKEQQRSSPLLHGGIFRPYARELEIEQSYWRDQPLNSPLIYLDNNLPDHLANASACKQSAVP